MKTVFFVGVVMSMTGYRSIPEQYQYYTRELGTNAKYTYVTEVKHNIGDTILMEFEGTPNEVSTQKSK